MNRPNFTGMVLAQAEFTTQIAKVMALLAPDNQGQLPEVSPAAADYASARLSIARKALDRFEAATKGGAA
jgi:hypothetical protein